MQQGIMESIRKMLSGLKKKKYDLATQPKQEKKEEVSSSKDPFFLEEESAIPELPKYDF